MSCLDAVQVGDSARRNVFTTIDGDQAGLIPNRRRRHMAEWHAARQYELSQRRRALEIVIPLQHYQFLLTTIIGLGLAVPQNVAPTTPGLAARIPTAAPSPRQITLTGRIGRRPVLQLRRARRFSGADRDASAFDQMLRLRYWRGRAVRSCRPMGAARREVPERP